MNILEVTATARDRTGRATSACGRTDSIHLGPAVKTRTLEERQAVIAILRGAGLSTLLGHNQVQEACTTAEAIREMSGACTHLIGPLQSNRISHALACVGTIESLDSPILASKIDTRTIGMPPVFVEASVSGEAMKHGCALAGVSVLVDVVEASAHLQLAGFVTVGLNPPVKVDMRAVYAQLRDIRDEVIAYLGIGESDLTLSISMSRGPEWAIAKDTTVMRPGTTIFNARRI